MILVDTNVLLHSAVMPSFPRNEKLRIACHSKRPRDRR